ncbi:hypothetical protein VTJ83DRAFT_2511 [Remersonia thermophila]|uniref:Subtelomeric hrmA-associated cluster protein AFUB-079030/YDR124W-like helical bundle domain-containing protein n=1 Tax=Remersonia thermophila TaxID=72144 RepID=A0ABR4DJ44_9PEZI
MIKVSLSRHPALPLAPFPGGNITMSPGGIAAGPRGFYGEHSRVWEETGRFVEPTQNVIDLMNVERNGPPMTVSRALREYCNIDFSSFFLAVHLGRGEFAYFAGPSPMSEDDIGQVFRRDRFLRFQGRDSSVNSPAQARGEDYVLDDAASRESRRRKRLRRAVRQRHPMDVDAPAVVVPSKRFFEIGDSDAVLNFYEASFKNIQQTACKEIAKAFIKVICPKKQAVHPYTQGWEKRPDWWPEPKADERARHIEPDHQLKKERIYVLKHILRLIVNPEELRPASIRKLGKITVAKLETAAMEALSAWFSDPRKPQNARKRPLVKELFRVAKMEERYKMGEIDETTRVFVTADDIAKDYCMDDDDDDDDDEGSMANTDSTRTGSIASTDVSPQAAAVPILPPLPGNNISTLSAQFQGASFFHEMPVRAHQYDASMLSSDLAAANQYHAYAEGLPAHHQAGAAMQPPPQSGPLQLHGMLAEAGPHDVHHPGHPDPGRRPSLFNAAPSEFAATAAAAAAPPSSTVATAGMYSAHWPQSSSPQTSPSTATSTMTTTTTTTTTNAEEPPHASMFYYAPVAGHPREQPQHPHQKAGNLLSPVPHYAAEFEAHAQHQQQQQQQQHQQHHQQQQQPPESVIFRGGNIHLVMQAAAHQASSLAVAGG